MLKKELPDNVHLLTLEYLEFNKFLLRLEHQFEATDPTHNNHVTVSLSVSCNPQTGRDIRRADNGTNNGLTECHYRPLSGGVQVHLSGSKAKLI